ncbi:hypothetical protein NPIL_649271 [Nephila pilipes]|uniref:Uncharacterized protein n=1 Tax=Nephila pilipes TaxID=299642 RepID=A0A8X6QM49_NEPPI|nr:hypothetical protein NPIL_649271 [Nephila pilipes]
MTWLRALQAEAASRSCDRDDEQKLSGREMVKKRGQQAEGAKGPSSLFLLSDDNLIRRYTKFIIEWPYPFSVVRSRNHAQRQHIILIHDSGYT